MSTNTGGDFAMTLQEIGDEFGLTRERVRQIQEKALGKIFKRFSIMYPEFDSFEIMAMLATGFKLRGKPVEDFYNSFPEWVKVKVKQVAHLHAPYLKKEGLEKVFKRKPLDISKEKV